MTWPCEACFEELPSLRTLNEHRNKCPVLKRRQEHQRLDDAQRAARAELELAAKAWRRAPRLASNVKRLAKAFDALKAAEKAWGLD